MRKFLMILFIFILFCGDSSQENISVGETTTSITSQETTTSSTSSSSTSTTTTILKKLHLIENFELKQDNTPEFPVGYIFAEVKSDITWDKFELQTTSEENNVCNYQLNDKQIDLSRLMFIPELGCVPGVYKISKIIISYDDTEYIFDSQNNEVNQYGDYLCCNFGDAFNWKVQIGRKVNDACKYGYLEIGDEGARSNRCIASFPEIKEFDISTDENNNIKINYDFAYDPEGGIDLNNTSVIFYLGFRASSSMSSDIGFYVSNEMKDTKDTFNANIWNDSITISNSSELLNQFELNTSYKLMELSISFFNGNTLNTLEIRDNLCSVSFRIYETFELSNGNYGYPVNAPLNKCNIENFEGVAYSEKTKGALPISPFDPSIFAQSWFFESKIDLSFNYQK